MAYRLAKSRLPFIILSNYIYGFREMSHSVLVEYLLWARHYAKCPEKKKVI